MQTDPSCNPQGRLSDLASKALSEVAARAGVRSQNTSNTSLVDRLLNAAMARSDETLSAASEIMIAQGVPAEVIVDDIVPRAARVMGEEWVRDISSFASVTLGAARLQTLVRKLGADWSADGTGFAQSTVLLWVPQFAQHTLGATVVSTQLRRMGHSVQFTPGGDLTDLAETLAVERYDALVISASYSERLSDVKSIVDKAKTLDATLPVVVGGTILKKHSDLTQSTGADVASCDLEKISQAFAVAK